MLFSVEVDQGDRISGYLVPDSYSDSTSLRISEGGQELAVFPCQDVHNALVVAGRHATGRCAFTIDQKTLPDLCQRLALELHEIETGLLIYRRRAPAEVTQKRIFRLETHLMPLWRLDDSLQHRFQFFHKSIERHGQETSAQLFLLRHASSQYLSGAVTFRAYEQYIDEGFTCIAMLREPFYELAERLLVLKHAQKAQQLDLFGERELMGLAPAIEFATAIENDEKRLRRLFATMSKTAIARLGNPVTRLLAARNSHEVPTRGAVVAALRALASFTVIGLREHQELFLDQLAEIIGVEAATLPLTPEFSKTLDLAETLRRVPEAEILIEQDLQIYHHVRSAIETAVIA
jgi:hypothetical protein